MNLRINRLTKMLLEIWKQPKFAWTLATLWMVLIVWVAFVWNLGSIGLVDETEPLFAEAARQMVVTGDWVTPYFDGATRFDKPPLIYWLMAIAYQTIGVNEWAVRLPSALAAIALTGFSCYTLGHFGFPIPAAQAIETQQNNSQLARQIDLQRWLSALIGATLLAINPLILVWARTGVSDLLLTSCMGISLLAFFWGYAQPLRSRSQKFWYLGFYLFSSLAVLTKGPVGIVLPGLVILCFLIYLGNWGVLREMQILRGSILFLILTLPWYILVIQANGEAYINTFFGYHNFERFTRVVNHHAAPWYFYFLVVLVGFTPWSIYLPVAIARLRFWQPAHWRQQPRSAHLGLFALIWFTVIFAFFTIAVTKLPSYVLPLIPAAAILIGLLWSDQMTRTPPQSGVQMSHVVSVVFLLILSGVALYSPHWLGNDAAMPDFPQVIQQSGISIWGSGIWAAAAVASLILLLYRQGRWIWSVQVIAFVAFVGLAVMPAAQMMDAQRQLPLRQLAEVIVQKKQPTEEIIMIGFSKPSLVFYTQQSVSYIPDPDGVMNRLWRISTRKVPPVSVLIIGYPRKLKEAGLQRNQYQTLGQSGAYELVRVDLPLETGNGG